MQSPKESGPVAAILLHLKKEGEDGQGFAGGGEDDGGAPPGADGAPGADGGDDHQQEVLMAAQSLMDAVHKGDPQAVADALYAAFQCFAEEPPDDGGGEGEPDGDEGGPPPGEES